MLDENLEVISRIDEDKDLQKSITPSHSYILFSLSVILLVYFASYFQSKNFSTGVLITQFVFVALPPIIFAKILKLNLKSLFRINRVSLKNVFLSISILLFSLPLISIINVFYILLIKNIFGNISSDKIPIAENISQLFLYILIIGVLAGICEEVLFRGFIMRGIEKFGTTKALMISSILFASLHLKIEKLPATFFLGLIIAFCVYRTNSIFTGMAMHFANNSLVTFLSFLVTFTSGIKANKESEFTQVPDFRSLLGSSEEKTIIFITLIIFLIITIAIFSSIVYFLVQALVQNTSFTVASKNQKFTKKDTLHLSWLIPGVLLILLITFSEIAHLLESSPKILIEILRFLSIGKD